MGKIGKIIAILFLFVGIFAIYKMVNSNDVSSENILIKYLDIKNIDFSNRFIIDTLENNNKVVLVNYIDSKSSISSNYILMYSGSGTEIIKGLPYMFNDNIDTNYANHVGGLINLEAFNKYLELKKILNKNLIFEKYMDLLSYSGDVNYHKIIYNLPGLRNVLIDYPADNIDFLRKNGFGFKVLELENINIETNVNEGVVYCWFINKGLVRFEFNMEGNRIQYVKSNILGYVGNEIPSCC